MHRLGVLLRRLAVVGEGARARRHAVNVLARMVVVMVRVQRSRRLMVIGEGAGERVMVVVAVMAGVVVMVVVAAGAHQVVARHLVTVTGQADADATCTATAHSGGRILGHCTDRERRQGGEASGRHVREAGHVRAAVLAQSSTTIAEPHLWNEIRKGKKEQNRELIYVTEELGFETLI